MGVQDFLGVSFADLRSRELGPVTVVVADSGIDATHPGLEGRVVACHAIVESEGEFSVDDLEVGIDNDVCGHGTGVAGMIAQVAPNARIIDLRVLDENNQAKGETLLHAFRWAVDCGAEVINLSLASSRKYAQELALLCEDAYANGQMVVASKRNVPLRDDGYPAELANCISVDIGDVTSIYDVMYAPKRRIEFVGAGEDVKTFARGGGYRYLTGTSFATPQVSGIVSLLLGADPDLRPFEVKTLLKLMAAAERS